MQIVKTSCETEDKEKKKKSFASIKYKKKGESL